VTANNSTALGVSFAMRSVREHNSQGKSNQRPKKGCDYQHIEAEVHGDYLQGEIGGPEWVRFLDPQMVVRWPTLFWHQSGPTDSPPILQARGIICVCAETRVCVA
jgi:hypothetical protein